MFGFTQHGSKKTALTTILFIISSIVLLFLLKQSYQNSIAQSEQIKLNFATNQIAYRFEEEVANHIRALKIVSQQIDFSKLSSQKDYLELTNSIISDLPDFLTINWIRAEGVITWVNPLERNQAALGKRIIEHPEVDQYLMQSRITHEPHLSHIVKLYQGQEGFTIYVPIFRGDTFYGWVNGVILYKSFLDSLFAQENFQNYSIRINWKKNKDKFYEYNISQQIDKVHGKGQFSFKLFNQEFEVEVLDKNVQPVYQRSSALTLIFIIALIFAVFAFMAVILNLRTQENLKQRNRELKVSQALVEVFNKELLENHQLLKNEMNTIDLSIESLKNKIISYLKTEADLLTKIRDMRDFSFENKSIHLIHVRVCDFLKQTQIAIYKELKEKSLQFIFDENSQSRIFADPPILQRYIFRNILSYYIEVTAEKKVIQVHISDDRDQTYIEFESETIPSNSSRYELMQKHRVSFLQTQAFMEYFSGQFIYDAEKNKLKLIFPNLKRDK